MACGRLIGHRKDIMMRWCTHMIRPKRPLFQSGLEQDPDIGVVVIRQGSETNKRRLRTEDVRTSARCLQSCISLRMTSPEEVEKLLMHHRTDYDGAFSARIRLPKKVSRNREVLI